MAGPPRPGEDRGFTLVELAVVVAIVAILTAIAVPLLLGARTHAADAAVETDADHLRTAASSLIASDAAPSAFGPLDGTKATPDVLPAAWRAAGATLGPTTSVLSYAPVDGGDQYCIRASRAGGATWYATAQGITTSSCASR